MKIFSIFIQDYFMKEKKNDRIAKVLNTLKHPLQPSVLWFFSDEKNFYQDQIMNSQKNRCPYKIYQWWWKQNNQSTL